MLVAHHRLHIPLPFPRTSLKLEGPDPLGLFKPRPAVITATLLSLSPPRPPLAAVAPAGAEEELQQGERGAGFGYGGRGGGGRFGCVRLHGGWPSQHTCALLRQALRLGCVCASHTSAKPAWCGISGRQQLAHHPYLSAPRSRSGHGRGGHFGHSGGRSGRGPRDRGPDPLAALFEPSLRAQAAAVATGLVHCLKAESVVQIGERPFISRDRLHPLFRGPSAPPSSSQLRERQL